MQDGQTDPTKTVEDKRVLKNTNIQLGVGQEHRKGEGRLQGFYGPQAMVGLSGNSTQYTYGNDFQVQTLTQPIEIGARILVAVILKDS